MNDKKKTGFPVALVISLCVNAALIGGAAALLISMQSDRHEDWRAERHGPRTPNGGPLEEQLSRSAQDILSPEDRRKFRQQLAKEFRNARVERLKLIEARQSLVALLMADQFDRDAILAAFDKVKVLEDDLRVRLRTRVLDLLESLPVDQRQSLIGYMSQQHVGQHMRHLEQGTPGAQTD